LVQPPEGLVTFPWVNVAATRARRKLIVVGNGASFGRRGGLLGRFMEEAE
jgi:superfamily I DNA and/or RNA helicase